MRFASIALALGLWVSGCQSRHDGQLVVVVASAAPLTAVVVKAAEFPFDGSFPALQMFAIGTGTGEELPLSVVVRADGGDSRVRIVVDGFRDCDPRMVDCVPVARRLVFTEFVPDETRVLRMDLAECAPESCPALDCPGTSLPRLRDEGAEFEEVLPEASCGPPVFADAGSDVPPD